MSVRPELFRVLAEARRLPSGEEDWEAWQKAYEVGEDALAALDEAELNAVEPALGFLHGGWELASRERTRGRAGLDPRDDEISEISLTAAADRIRRRELSPVELVQAMVDRIDAYGKTLNAYIAWYPEQAVQQARKAEDALARGRPVGPLHGVPVAVKDLFFTAGLPTTAGARVLADFVPQEDATVIHRLKEAGAILLGKLNLHELAYGVTNENPHFGPVRNPWNLNRISGGSSGGSAAAVAASLCLASLGTDTGGSIRIPASCCGVVGLKPTYGRVSRNGILPLAWSLDHVGPITRTVEDAALMLQVLAGEDSRDVTTSALPVPDYARLLGGDLKGLRIGLVSAFFTDPAEVDPSVMAAVREALQTMESVGARVEEVSVPFLRHAPAIQYITLATEASANHARLLRTRGRELGLDVRRRLELGEFITAPQYVRAQQGRRLLMQELAAVFRRVDLLITPTLPVVAPPIGDQTLTIHGVEKRVQPTLTRCTSFVNLTGLPAISLPCGSDADGLPVGLQLIGQPFDEATLLRGAYAYQQASAWHTRRPSLGS
ncbi:MAG: Asp-tRNA(Asn)/Glu-tRNA(Gln) amidotransferase subunit GatA [candidate division NC10 bacterium]|nr:Asp-tRNA(Asn)/Glu-tRNA(Gln) amidotransferase subunit GatA [candidate division NC10 bacterium]